MPSNQITTMFRSHHLIIFSTFLFSSLAADDHGTLIFEDQFERSESQELKDEPGNEWTTSSDKTAKGNKQVDLRDGAIYIFTHAEANHATSFRHEFSFRNGSVGLRFKLDDKSDSLTLNFADLSLKSVHAGHLFKVVITPDSLRIVDQKSGEMNLALRQARSAGTLSDSEKEFLLTKSQASSLSLKTGEWHEAIVTVEGDKLTCMINGKVVAEFQSEGFAHETKKLLRLLAARNAWIDDVQIWRKD